MTGFSRAAHQLACDGVPLSAIAQAEGTPVYVYSAAVLRDRYLAIDRAFGPYPHRLHYALKANSTLGLARVLKDLGSGADANSIWEIELARKAGFQPPDIVFSGVGKSPAELECAVPLGLKAIKAAGGMAMVQDPKTAEYDRMPLSAIATGLADYVLPAEDMPAALCKYAALLCVFFPDR